MLVHRSALALGFIHFAFYSSFDPSATLNPKSTIAFPMKFIIVEAPSLNPKTQNPYPLNPKLKWMKNKVGAHVPMNAITSVVLFADSGPEVSCMLNAI